MSRKLQKLIAHYEAERDTLVAQFDECVAEDDYAAARRFLKGIRLVDHRLQTLLNLQDPRHDEKAQALRLLLMLENMKKAPEKGLSQRFYAEQISAAQKRLAGLEGNPAPPPSAPKPTALQDALQRLADKRIESFTFVFSRSARLSCVVKLVRKTLIIILPEVRRHREEYLLKKRESGA